MDHVLGAFFFIQTVANSVVWLFLFGLAHRFVKKTLLIPMALIGTPCYTTTPTTTTTTTAAAAKNNKLRSSRIRKHAHVLEAFGPSNDDGSFGGGGGGAAAAAALGKMTAMAASEHEG